MPGKLYTACSFALADVTTRRGHARRGYFSTLAAWNVTRVASVSCDPPAGEVEAKPITTGKEHGDS